VAPAQYSISVARQRGRSVALPSWWLGPLRSIVAAGTASHRELGIALAATAGRLQPWAQSSVSRFLAGTHTPDDLAEAFQRHFALPPYVVQPRDLTEALVVSRAIDAHRQTASAPRAQPDGATAAHASPSTEVEASR
jgi:hypothetical protein